jgi:hypothetical protein
LDAKSPPSRGLFVGWLAVLRTATICFARLRAGMKQAMLAFMPRAGAMRRRHVNMGDNL